MKEKNLEYLVCPDCQESLVIAEVAEKVAGKIKNGRLQCRLCNEIYEIVNFIPRFVPSENYASGFGFEWTRHAKTQYDSYTGTDISRTRFFKETEWPEDLTGEIILEAGSGSGRFTEQAASTNAMVVSLDYSYAVEANYASNGNKDNVLIIQADIYHMPLRKGFFDKIFCFGVLQHTPDARKAFFNLPKHLKSGGSLVIDVYSKIYRGIFWYKFNTKYWVRPLTKKIAPEKLYRGCTSYIEAMWPLSRIINKIPVLGRRINQQLLIPDYRGVYPLSEDLLKEWAILDTFDMLSPAFDFPQSINTVRSWFREADVVEVEIKYGYNGIEGRGTKV